MKLLKALVVGDDLPCQAAAVLADGLAGVFPFPQLKVLESIDGHPVDHLLGGLLGITGAQYNDRQQHHLQEHHLMGVGGESGRGRSCDGCRRREWEGQVM